MALIDLKTTIFSIQAPESVPHDSHNEKFRLDDHTEDSYADPKCANTDSDRGHGRDSQCNNLNISDVEPREIIIAHLAHREETPLVEPAGRILYAFHTFDAHPHSSTGWVFGSDKRRCDFVLARDVRTGVSGTHFSIEIERKTKSVMIRNLSRHGTFITVGTGSQIIQEVIILIEQNVEVHAGGLHIRIAIPVRDDADQDDYESNLEEFLAATNDVPLAELDGLTFRSAMMTPDTLRGQRSDYFLCRSLGQGSFGSVDLAYVPSRIGAIDWVAVKKVHNESLDASKYLRKEIDVLMTLSHEHIVRYRDVVFPSQTASPMLVMEYMTHGDLDAYWQKKPPLSSDVVVMLAQILQALSYLHQKQTTHRDIKPGNILIHSTGPFIAKLADFGLSSTKYLSKTFCGSPLYLAPEAFKAKRNKDRKAGFHWYEPGVDVWSLGIVGLKYSSRLPPYIDANDYYKRTSQLVSQQPGPLGQVLQEMLKTDPEERAAADDAFTMLKSILEQRDPKDASDSIGDGTIQWRTCPLGSPLSKCQPIENSAEEASTLRQPKRLFGELSCDPSSKSNAGTHTTSHD